MGIIQPSTFWFNESPGVLILTAAFSWTASAANRRRALKSTHLKAWEGEAVCYQEHLGCHSYINVYIYIYSFCFGESQQGCGDIAG